MMQKRRAGLRIRVLCFLLGLTVLNAEGRAVTLRTFGPSALQVPGITSLVTALPDANIYKEDFEDGAVNSFGLYQPLSPLTHGQIVESNDPGGRKLRSNFFAFRPTIPQRTTSYLRFAFDKESLGRLPTSVGLVWRDGPEDSILRITSYNYSYEIIRQDEFGGLNDLLPQAPFFIGAIYKEEVAFIEITATYLGDARAHLKTLNAS